MLPPGTASLAISPEATGARSQTACAGSGTGGSQNSLLEGDGFEPSVPRKKQSFLAAPLVPVIRLPQQKPALSSQGPMVRIHLPPAESLQTFGSCAGFGPRARGSVVRSNRMARGNITGGGPILSVGIRYGCTAKYRRQQALRCTIRQTEPRYRAPHDLRARVSNAAYRDQVGCLGRD